jgi:hypothetical protein
MQQAEVLLAALLVAVVGLSVLASRLVRSVLAAQREALLKMRGDGSLSNETWNRLQRELDLEESRLET